MAGRGGGCRLLAGDNYGSGQGGGSYCSDKVRAAKEVVQKHSEEVSQDLSLVAVWGPLALEP